MRDPNMIPNDQQLSMLDWLRGAIDQDQQPSIEDIALWRRRVRQVGTLPDPKLESIRMDVESRLADPGVYDHLLRLADLVSELSMLAEDGLERKPALEWPLDPVEEMHHEITEEKTNGDI